LKIAAAFALVVVMLLAMVLALGWVQGDFGGSGDPMTGTEQAYLEFVVSRLESGGTNMVINQIQSAFADVANLAPSERLQPLQDAAVDALSHSARFAELMEEAFKNDSADVSEEAVQELIAASNAYAEADDLLSEFIEQHATAFSGTALVS
jgi:acyl-CoA reductase-like NAD-dependent aldehyde dehydrogenase